MATSRPKRIASQKQGCPLRETEVDELWGLFLAVHRTWGNEACRAEDMASRWREFIDVKVGESPSYLEHYQSACEVLDELRDEHGDELYDWLLLGGHLHRSSDDRLLRLKRFVIDEFIRVYVSSGGFRSFGSRNYGGFVSGSRYRSQRPYRTYEDK